MYMSKQIILRYVLLLWLLSGFMGIPLSWAQQVRLDQFGTEYVAVTDYAGFTSPPQAGKFMIHLDGNSINLPNWSLKAKINSPIYAGEPNVGGIPFPAEKIRIRFTSDNGTSPTLSEIRPPMSPIPLAAGVETPLIARSLAPLQTGSNQHYLAIEIYYEISIEGGAYLDQMMNKNPYHHMKYQFPITFTLYDGSGRALNADIKNTQIHILPQLSGSPGPTEPAFSLEIIGNARDGSLNFTNLEHYLLGASVNYADAVKVNSKTAFELTVKSQQPHFAQASGETLPIDILQVELHNGSASPAHAQYRTVTLTTTPNMLMYSGTGSQQSMFMDLQYKTLANDQRLIQASSGKYSGVLVYELVPR